MLKVPSVRQFTSRLLGAILVLGLFPLSWAQAKPTYGAEIELTSNALNASTFDGHGRVEDSLERKTQLRFVELLKKRCQNSDCKITEVKGKHSTEFRVTYKDGWWFQVSFDPGCLEILWLPSTLMTLEKIEERIDADIFGTGEKLGLEAWGDDTNAHFNFGVKSAFGEDAELFLRFFVDYANHPDLALGSLGHDMDNAPPLSILKPAQREALKKIINEFYSGELKTIADLARAIERRIYYESYTPGWGATYHNQAVGLKHINNTDLRKSDAPMELRAIWAQTSADHFNQIARIIEARIEFLRTQKERIVYLGSERKEFTPSELRTRFHFYLLESKLAYADYENLLPEEIQEAELDPFFAGKKGAPFNEAYRDMVQSSDWFKIHPSGPARASGGECRQIFLGL